MLHVAIRNNLANAQKRNTKMSKVLASLQTIEAKDKGGNNNTSALKVLGDKASFKMVQSLYNSYISDEDFSRFHAFLIQFDNFLVSMGAQRKDENGGSEDGGGIDANQDGIKGVEGDSDEIGIE